MLDLTRLQSALDAVAASINRQAAAPSLSMKDTADLLTAAANVLNAASATRLLVHTITGANPSLTNFPIVDFNGYVVQMVVVHTEDVSRILPTSLWTWNIGLGKLTLLNGYNFPSGSNVELYYTVQ